MINLERLCSAIDKLIAEQATASLPNFVRCYRRIEQFISEKYGKESEQYKNFIKRTFRPTHPTALTQDFVAACKRDLEATKAEL